MNIIKKIAANRIVCISFFAAALVYGLVLPFCWGNDPADTYGTLSLLCEDHIPFFWIWSILTGGCYLLNVEHMYIKFGYRSRLADVCLLLNVAGLLLTAATLNHSIADWNPKRIAHWVGAILFAICSALALLVFLLSNLKRKGFQLLLVIVVAIFGILAVWLFVFGRSGYMEMFPVAAVEILLFVVNFTPAIKTRDPISVS